MEHNPWVVLARVLRTRGNRGEVLADPLVSNPDRYAQLKQVWLRKDKRDAAPYELEAVWPYRERWVFKFRGVDTISAAEELVPADLVIPEESRAPVPDGEFYQADLVGCRVEERSTGRLIGEVRACQSTGATELLEVTAADDGSELLIPFARSICVEIDVANRLIRVDLPDGLLDLNRR